MGFVKVKSLNFRNINSETVQLDNAKNVFLVGPNGQGKTNFLEMIYYLCYASSFRTRNDGLIPNLNEQDFYCGSEYKENNLPINRIDIKYHDKKKHIKLNNQIIRDRKELIYQVPCIVFCHDDISFVNGQPERKRWFFDQTLSLKKPEYVDSLRRYKKLLKERNSLLKSRKFELLEIYSVQLVKEGIKLQTMRNGLIDIFNGYIREIFKELSNLTGDFYLSYQPSWKNISDEKEAYQFLDKNRHKEIEKGLTLSGPHRDNYKFVYNKGNFLDIASTGQIRLVSLILKIIQAQYFVKNSNKLPVFLLDDVLLELDRNKREKFLSRLPDYEQAFFTFLPGDDTYNSWENSLHLTVEEGRIFERSIGTAG